MSTLLEECTALAPQFRNAAAEGDASRKVSAGSVAALMGTGAFKMLVPRAYGGLETPPGEMVAVIEEVARADSALGWCLMVGATSGLLAAYVAPEAGLALFGDEDALACGVFAPSGEATELPSGEYRVRGRWAFASGSGHAKLRTVGVLVMRDGKPALAPDGELDIRHVILDDTQTRVVDTWETSGLRGTGSHDLVAEDAVVPPARVLRFVGAKPLAKGVLYTFPPMGLLALGVSAVCLGIAREAVNELLALATKKKPMGARRTIAERELVQVAVGEAEALVSSARAFVMDAASDVLAKATRDGSITDTDKARLRLAATHATRSCARAVDLMYEASGATGIYKRSALERHFRDIHVATQHAMVAAPTYALAGRIAMGLGVERTAL